MNNQGKPVMIGAKTPGVARFWNEMRRAKGIAASDYHATTFADPALSQNVDKIGNLAVEGKKRATAHLALDFERNGIRRRAPGDYWVILNSSQQPICLVRVIRVEVKPFNEVAEETAIAEGTSAWTTGPPSIAAIS